MNLKKNDDKKNNSGRSVEEDLQRLQESGINVDPAKDPKEGPLPETKEQQKTGDTERSDRRL
jgi:hypothetical protein